MDEALSAVAARRGVSRSAIVREAVTEALANELDAPADPIDAWVGSVKVEPDDDLDGDIDAVIYETSA